MIYAIIGPTGVGKTDISIRLAKKLNASVINCDSMQIYKELNIGTNKITNEEMSNIKHYLLSIKSIKEDYSVYEYQKDGRNIINKLLSENKNIIIVGGTGLYLKALLYDYSFDNKQNKDTKLYNFKLIGLTRNRENLYKIINDRVDLMIKQGLLNEVKSLYDKNIKTRAINTAIGYKELYNYFDGLITLEEAIDKIKQASRNYAKRQYTFFNNQFKDIIWLDVDNISKEEIINKITG